MGITDSSKVHLSCENCGTKDTVKAVEKGSGYGNRSWTPFSDSKLFDFVEVVDAVFPRIESGTCKSCGQSATIAG